jgi:hypothetical protein
MTKVETIKNFNLILGDFLQQVSPIIGTTYHHYFTQLIKANSIEPIRKFTYYVHNSEKPLAQYIQSRDEEYFKNTDNYKESLIDSNTTLFEIIKLEGIYSQLDENSKDNLWGILQALLHLSKEYNN